VTRPALRFPYQVKGTATEPNISRSSESQNERRGRSGVNSTLGGVHDQ